LKLEAQPLTDYTLRLRITDAHTQRWEVPQWLLKSGLLPGGSQRQQRGAASQGGTASEEGAPRYPQYKLAVKQEPFSLEVSGPEEGLQQQRAAAGQAGAAGSGSSGGGTLFNTTGLRLVFKARGAGGPHSHGKEAGSLSAATAACSSGH
jgi:hypothetical protein